MPDAVHASHRATPSTRSHTSPHGAGVVLQHPQVHLVQRSRRAEAQGQRSASVPRRRAASADQTEMAAWRDGDRERQKPPRSSGNTRSVGRACSLSTRAPEQRWPLTSTPGGDVSDRPSRSRPAGHGRDMRRMTFAPRSVIGLRQVRCASRRHYCGLARWLGETCWEGRIPPLTGRRTHGKRILSTRASSISGTAGPCRCSVATTVEEAGAGRAGGYPVAVKAQVQVGKWAPAASRGRCRRRANTRQHQAWTSGPSRRVWIEHASISEEYYASHFGSAPAAPGDGVCQGRD
jgi:hypothetical protein